MFTFTSFAVRHGGDNYLSATRHHPDAEDELDSDIDMDEEEEDFGEGSARAKLTTPGEMLTSAQAFMRYVVPNLRYLIQRITQGLLALLIPVMYLVLPILQRTWHVRRRRRSNSFCCGHGRESQ